MVKSTATSQQRVLLTTPGNSSNFTQQIILPANFQGIKTFQGIKVIQQGSDNFFLSIDEQCSNNSFTYF